MGIALYSFNYAGFENGFLKIIEECPTCPSIPVHVDRKGVPHIRRPPELRVGKLGGTRAVYFSTSTFGVLQRCESSSCPSYPLLLRFEIFQTKRDKSFV